MEVVGLPNVKQKGLDVKDNREKRLKQFCGH